jgi:beta-glucanase (GH16 family)
VNTNAAAPRSTRPKFRAVKLVTALSLCVFSAGFATAEASVQAHPAKKSAKAAVKPLGVPGKWKLVLNSNFASGKSINGNVWRKGWFGTGVTDPINVHEDACYNSSNVRTRKGGVNLVVSHIASDCKDRTRMKKLAYTGAVLSTNPKDGRKSGGFQYRYGVIQVKVYLPGVNKTRVANWPAVATFGQVWPKDGEDDVVENLKGRVCSHFHSPGYAPGGDLGRCDGTFKPGWHVVSANWEPHSVAWYYDGKLLKRVTKGVTSQKQYITLVNTVSLKALKLGRSDAMRVAYVRVWQRAKKGKAVKKVKTVGKKAEIARIA